jgi:hypothetical protein
MQRQIIKTLSNQIDIEDPAYRKYAITDFHSIVWMFIVVIVTIYRNTIESSQGYIQVVIDIFNNELRSSI